MGGEVLYDGWCGEPIAWARLGDPVIGREWTEHGWVAVTDRLSAAEAFRKYGPITELVVGRNRGFESVTYGATKFVSRFVDPRGTGLYDDTVVVVRDPARDNHECPVCQAAPGEQCMSKKKQPCGTHSKRSQGRSRWEIEQADAAVRKAREEAEAAERWQREMATPPIRGAVLEVKRWMLTEASDDADRYTVEWTYANRTVQATAGSGERVFLARNEYTSGWHVICGQPTSTRLPCRGGGAGVPCTARHKPGLHLREDSSWT
ncbi:hypothetical protein [Amycolatopsis jejuensis]|uniref:hypothetical protein n=1 Tax=Amycolatopsis jejuensis TaxID=330084 RepID=UPI000524FF14|nr:hypothetical protein [Amycolatopsis jejuensis]